MLTFIIIAIAILGIILLFGKTDSKRAVLNMAGLDYKESVYERKKEKEFEQYCIKAMKNSLTLCKDEYNVNNEMDMLKFLADKLEKGSGGKYEVDFDNSYNNEETYKKVEIYLGVDNHYAEHALNVVNRRLKDIKENSAKTYECDFKNMNNARKYIAMIWEKYQRPWPKNWKQEDSM